MYNDYTRHPSQDEPEEKELRQLEKEGKITNLIITSEELLIRQLNELVWEHDTEYGISTDHTVIYMPIVLHRVLEDHIRKSLTIGGPITDLRFRGYKILPGYEKKLIIANVMNYGTFYQTRL